MGLLPSTGPSVAAPGSRGPVLGSNPIAYGIPFEGGDPILLDMATAAVAGAEATGVVALNRFTAADWTGSNKRFGILFNAIYEAFCPENEFS